MRELTAVLPGAAAVSSTLTSLAMCTLLGDMQRSRICLTESHHLGKSCTTYSATLQGHCHLLMGASWALSSRSRCAMPSATMLFVWDHLWLCCPLKSGITARQCSGKVRSKTLIYYKHRLISSSIVGSWVHHVVDLCYYDLL